MILGERFKVRALLLGVRLDARRWPEGEVLSTLPLAIRLAAGGIAVLFRYGVAVLFDVPAESESALRERLAAIIDHPYASADVEELDVRVARGHPEGMHEGALVVQDAATARLQVIADVLSKSVLLAHYETRIAGDFDRIEPLALQLERTGRMRGSTRAHVRQIGALLLIEQRMVGRAETGEKPDVLWEHPELERFYALLEDEFEVRERLAALERKLGLVGRTVRMLVDLIDARHSLRVEWYIVALIVFEIVLTLVQMLTG
jgi:uncharacterized Rmd1/YagE family protein